METESEKDPQCNQERCSGITPGTTRYLGKVKWYDAVKVGGFFPTK